MQVMLWNLLTGRLILDMPCNSPVTNFLCVRGTGGHGGDKVFVLAACDNGRVHVWRLKFATSKVRAKRVTTLQVCDQECYNCLTNMCQRLICMAPLKANRSPYTQGHVDNIERSEITDRMSLYAAYITGSPLLAWQI